MPRFAPDPNDARVTTRVFPFGQYELTVNNIIGFVRNKRDGDGVSAGVMIFPKMVGKVDSEGNVDPEFADEDVAPLRCYVHSDGAWRMTKGYLMAILGYGRDDEDQFNEDYSAESFFVDGEPDDKESLSIGDGWSELEGKRFHATLVEDEWDGKPSQDYQSVFSL